MKLATRIFRRSDWYVTSPFGWRTDPISGEKKFHNGCDYGTHISKWPQYALEDGVVESAGKDSSGAIFTWVKYPRLGFRLLHYHLSSVCVKAGQTVNKDTVLGYTGTTGYSTGIHLHLGKKKIGSSTYEDAHSYDYQEEVVTPEPEPVVLKYKVGDKVVFTGRLYANSYGEKPGQERTNLLSVISLTNSKGSKPYNINGGLGWVAEADLKPYVEPTPTPEPTPVPEEEDMTGKSVIVNGRGKSDSLGGGATTRLFSNQVMRVITDKSKDGRPYPYACNQYNQSSGVTAWFRKEDCKKK